MKSINTSIFDSSKLRDLVRNCVYVDKTAQLYELARPTSADWIYYLPRPRRFGKSLMISTLKALFQGRRELFEGLAIDRMPIDFATTINVERLDAPDAQCREKNYAAPYADDPRPVWYIALNCNAAKRTLDDPLCEQQSTETRRALTQRAV